MFLSSWKNGSPIVSDSKSLNIGVLTVMYLGSFGANTAENLALNWHDESTRNYLKTTAEQSTFDGAQSLCLSSHEIEDCR